MKPDSPDAAKKSGMDRRFKAFALNLLYPGAGQILLKRWMTALVFIIAASAALAWLGWILVHFFSAVYKAAIEGMDFDEADRLKFMTRIAASASLLCLVWLASFAEIFIPRRKR